jgi:hypothetical protein
MKSGNPSRRWLRRAPPASAIAGHLGGFAPVLNLDQVPPGIGLAAVEIGEAVYLRQLSNALHHELIHTDPQDGTPPRVTSPEHAKTGWLMHNPG